MATNGGMIVFRTTCSFGWKFESRIVYEYAVWLPGKDPNETHLGVMEWAKMMLPRYMRKFNQVDTFSYSTHASIKKNKLVCFWRGLSFWKQETGHLSPFTLMFRSCWGSILSSRIDPLKSPRPPSLQAAATVRHWAALARRLSHGGNKKTTWDSWREWKYIYNTQTTQKGSIFLENKSPRSDGNFSEGMRRGVCTSDGSLGKKRTCFLSILHIKPSLVHTVHQFPLFKSCWMESSWLCIGCAPINPTVGIQWNENLNESLSGCNWTLWHPFILVLTTVLMEESHKLIWRIWITHWRFLFIAPLSPPVQLPVSSVVCWLQSFRPWRRGQGAYKGWAGEMTLWPRG